MNPAMDQVLMVYHRIYDSFAWTGGHADGSSDFLWTAVREAKEETGIQKPYPLTGAILSLDILPVKAHQKKGVPVPAPERNAADPAGRKHCGTVDPCGTAAGNLQRAPHAAGL